MSALNDAFQELLRVLKDEDERKIESVIGRINSLLSVNDQLSKDLLGELVLFLTSTSVVKLKLYAEICKLLIRIIDGNGQELRDLFINLKLDDALISLSKRPFAVSAERSKDVLILQRLIWSTALSMLNITPLPRLEQLFTLRSGVEIFLKSTLHAPLESKYQISLPNLSDSDSVADSTFIFPSYLSTDSRLLDTICRLVSKLADTDIIGANASPVWASSSVLALLRLMGHGSSELRLQALLAIGNLLAGSDAQTDSVLTCGFLAAVSPLVSDTSLAVRKEAFWSLSNITAGSVHQIKLVLETTIMKSAIEAFGHEERQDIRNETAWLVCNALCGSNSEQRQIMIDNSVLLACSKFLQISNCGNVRVSLVVVNGIESILKHANDNLWAFNPSIVLDEARETQRKNFLAQFEASKLPTLLRPLLRARSKSELYRKVTNIFRVYFNHIILDDCLDSDPCLITGDFIPQSTLFPNRASVLETIERTKSFMKGKHMIM